MKGKILLLTLIAILAVSLALTGCGTKTETSASTGSSEQSVDLTMVTGSTTSTNYLYGVAIANAIKGKVSANITVKETGGSVDDANALGKNEAQLAIAQNDILAYASSGTGKFQGNQIKDLEAIGAIYSNVLHIVARKDSGINGIEDFRGKRISMGSKGSGTEENGKQVLEAVKLTIADLRPTNMGHGEGAKALNNNEIDAYFSETGMPNKAVKDSATNGKLISLSDFTTNLVTSKYPVLFKYTIPNGTYEGQAGDVNTIGVKNVLAVRKDVSEETVYQITKALFEAKQQLAQDSTIPGSELSEADALKGISLPLHAGAIKYYKEKGLL